MATLGGAVAHLWRAAWPWRWMLLVYAYLDADDRVVVVSVRDACSSTSARV
jgi:hypothetical protein